jgi:hypothetical protein
MNDIALCFNCSNKVVPMSDGRCPSCQKPMRTGSNTATAVATPPPAGAPGFAAAPQAGSPGTANPGAPGAQPFTPYKAPANTGGGSGAGTTNIVIGGLMLGIGILITVGSYSAASSNPNGGTYVVTWGLIIFGAIRLFRGLAQRGSG